MWQARQSTLFTIFLGFFFQRQQPAIVFISVAIIVSIYVFHQFSSSFPRRFWCCQKQDDGTFFDHIIYSLNHVLQPFSQEHTIQAYSMRSSTCSKFTANKTCNPKAWLLNSSVVKRFLLTRAVHNFYYFITFNAIFTCNFCKWFVGHKLSTKRICDGLMKKHHFTEKCISQCITNSLKLTHVNLDNGHLNSHTSM